MLKGGGGDMVAISSMVKHAWRRRLGGGGAYMAGCDDTMAGNDVLALRKFQHTNSRAARA